MMIMRKNFTSTTNTDLPKLRAPRTAARLRHAWRAAQMVLRVGLVSSSALLMAVIGPVGHCPAQPRAGAASPQLTATPALSPPATTVGGPISNEDFSKLPTTITSETLTLLAAERLFIYKGNVVVTQGDMKLTSKTLEGSYGTDNQIQRLIAKGDVTITKQEIEARGQQAVYDAPTATVLLTESPEVKQGESILTAERIRVFLQENRSQAEGGVRVTLVKNSAAAAPSFLSFGKEEEKSARTATGAVVATPTPRTTAVPTIAAPAERTTLAPAFTDTEDGRTEENSARADKTTDRADGVSNSDTNVNSGSDGADAVHTDLTTTTASATPKGVVTPAPTSRPSSSTAQRTAKSPAKKAPAQKKPANKAGKARKEGK